MTVDYELAKKLKDAGFPQEGEGKIRDEVGRVHSANDDFTAYLPTLSELIEACGEHFVSLTYFGNTVGPDDLRGDWTATGIRNRSRWGDGRWDEAAKTPTGAVAKLWLAMNT